MKEIGKTTWQMVMVNIIMQMGPSIRVTGSTTSKMAEESKSRQMGHHTRANTILERRMVEVFSPGRIIPNSMALLLTIISMAMVSIAGLMGEYTKELGFKTKWKGKENSGGMTVAFMKVNM